MEFEIGDKAKVEITRWEDKQRTCDFCGENNLKTLIDGKTIFGPWAVMCEFCHLTKGIGIGLGKGQKYISDGKGSLIKIEG